MIGRKKENKGNKSSERQMNEEEERIRIKYEGARRVNSE